MLDSCGLNPLEACTMINTSPSFNIEQRVLIEYNNDPQRRCYDGCHASVARTWSEWSVLEYDLTPKKAEQRLAFWKDLTAYAVSQRGEANTLTQFRLVPYNSIHND